MHSFYSVTEMGFYWQSVSAVVVNVIQLLVPILVTDTGTSNFDV